MVDKDCFIPNCKKNDELPLDGNSIEEFSCDWKFENLIHPITNSNLHVIKTDYSPNIRNTKKALLDFIHEEKLKQEKFTRKIIDSMTIHLYNMRNSHKEFLSEFANYKMINDHFKDLLKETSCREQNSVWGLLNLPPEEAIEKLKIMTKWSESNFYACKYFELTESMHKKFQNKWLKIKNSLNDPDRESQIKFNLETIIGCESKNETKDLSNPFKNSNKDKLESDLADIKDKSEKYISSFENKINSREQLLVDDKNLSSFIYCIERRNIHFEIVKGEICETGEKVAVKLIYSENFHEVQKHINEVKIYEKLSSKNSDIILKYYGHFYDEKRKKTKTIHKLYIVIELEEFTLMDEFLEKKKKKLHYEKHAIAKNVYDLLDLFRKLSQENIVFCCIEPQDILIANGKFKLENFYLAKTSEEVEESSSDTKYHDFLRSINYMAPELREMYMQKWIDTKDLSEERQLSTEKSDVFSLGMVFLMMIILRSINFLNDYQHRHRLNEIIDNLELGWTRRLLRKMLASSCEERPRFEEALRMVEADPEFISCLNSSN